MTIIMLHRLKDSLWNKRHSVENAKKNLYLRTIVNENEEYIEEIRTRIGHIRNICNNQR